jgi:ribosomal protein L7/L12
VPSDADEIAQLKLEVQRLSRLVDELYTRIDGVPPDGTVDAGSPPADVIAALQSGNVIEAIKLWREHTGVGLAEAKSAVEDVQRRLGL